MTLPLNGERLIPDAQFGSRDYRDHMARYFLACEIAAARVERRARPDSTVIEVLDVASGEGYGTNMLAAVGARAIGADVDPRAVMHAKERYSLTTKPHPPAFFIQDVQRLPTAWTGKFDVVTCFETIEHVERWEDALDGLRRVLAPGGVLLISTPNKGVYGAGNPYHVREHTTSEFEAMLRERWRWVLMMRQVEMPTSLLVADPSAGQVAKMKHTSVDRLPSEMYAVAVCADGPVDVPAIAVS